MGTKLQVLCKSQQCLCAGMGTCLLARGTNPSFFQLHFIGSEAGNRACLAESISRFFLFAYTINLIILVHGSTLGG